MTVYDETKRRAYWTSQMNEGYDFMMRIMKHPVIECGEKPVLLGPAAIEAGVEVGAAQVGVDEERAPAATSEVDAEVGADEALADAALPAADGEDAPGTALG